MKNLRLLPFLLAALTCAVAPLTAQKQAKIDFAKQIFPIFEKNCTECHRETYVDENGRRRRPKGRVMLDTLKNIEKSKRGKLIVAKKPDDSILMESITLPADDEDRMPPPKKGGPLPKKDIELIREWIAQGADYGKWTGEDAGDDAEETGDPKKDDPKKDDSKPSSSRSKRTTRRGPAPIVALAKGLRPVKAATLAAFEDGPFQVRSMGDGNPLLSVSCCGKTEQVKDKDLDALAPIADHIFELDLARSHVGDACCAAIAKMPRLTKLDLRETDISDKGVKTLAACKELRSLNLFGTEVGDYAMLAVAELKNLEKLYIWQTDVTAKAAVRLREQLPNAEIVFVADLPEPGDGGR